MKPPKPELSYIINLDTLNFKNPLQDYAIDANEKERKALAARFDLPGIETLHADLRLETKQGGDWVEVSGRISSKLQQSCVVTAEPVDAEIDEEFFTEYKRSGPVDEEDDAEFLESNQLDIGEVVAQYFYMALDPFPRKKSLSSGENAPDTHRPFQALFSKLDKPVND